MPRKRTDVEEMLAAIPDADGNQPAFQAGYLTSFLEALSRRHPVVAAEIAERTAMHARKDER